MLYSLDQSMRLAKKLHLKACLHEQCNFVLRSVGPRRVARWFIFKQKIQIWVNFERPRMEMLVYFTYGHLEYFTVIWYTLWPFGNVVVIWYIFPRLGMLCQEKSGNPGRATPCDQR
jgi:hypothetical protein